MIPKIFVSATNTNVGKTFAMQNLIVTLSEKGYKVGVIKPIETGVEDEPLDAKIIFELAKQYNPNLDALTLDDICPYQFALPAAPFVAKDDTVIEMDVIKAAVTKIEQYADIILIEGAGGLMVPVQEDQLMVDMAKELADHILLVVPSRLGSINDTLLSMYLLENYGVKYTWAINLFEDKEHFDRVTKPYYEKKHPQFLTLQNDLDKIVEKFV